MIYDRKFNNSRKSMKELSDDIPLKHIYKISGGAKKILLQDIFNLGDNFIHIKDKMINSANDLLELTKDTRLSDFIPDWSGYHKDFNLPDDPTITKVFDAVKLHWLVNDVKINGLGYPPQGHFKGELFVCHPGTYRFYAAFAQQLNTHCSVWDSHNIFDKEPLSLPQWINFCTKGFLRIQRNLEIKSGPDTQDYLEIHELTNNHDWNIFNQDKGIGEMFDKKLPVIFSNCHKKIKEIKGYTKPNLFPDKNFVYIDDKFLVPNELNFKGVGIYIDKNVQITEDIAYLILYLDINDDCASGLNNDILLFNCSSHNCKKLIPGIVQESTNEYLQKLLWASKVSFIPEKIINGIT